ncbi:flagellar hook-length control protein FliK [Ovoidimarina sediminis]|uniref:flagellar hook-length control protein FliK n=1 Tax=Ovoidimarina sediminis TaxID=3079856 RepID=UPI0029147039|nr:flagellar hook-length control protein FliK [Rhodophyticola sp. MJ-SS7]MDU8942582.1 flagellar hook-length control protein FliK [Rhodophyticola sp. MJ-SS7]
MPAAPIGGGFEQAPAAPSPAAPSPAALAPATPAPAAPAPAALVPAALVPAAPAPDAPRLAAQPVPASPPTPVSVPITQIQARAERPGPPRPSDLPEPPAAAVRVEPAGSAPPPPPSQAIPLWTGVLAKPVSQVADSTYSLSADAAPLPFADGWERNTATPHILTAADPQQARTADTARGPALQIAEALRLGPGTFDITLHPEELGKLTVTVTAEDGKLIVILAAERGDTLDLLRRNADLLATEAAKGGFTDLDLSFADNRHAGQGRPDQGAAPATADVTGGTVTAATAIQPPRAAGPMGGGLDLRL